MMMLRKGRQPLTRSNAIDPNVDTTNSAYMNYPLLSGFIAKWSAICANREKYQEKLSEYVSLLPDK